MYKMNLIKIAGFRRLRDVNLEARPFMVLIGANGAGKTSFLDALRLLSESASGHLSGALSRLGGISNILTRGRSEELRFGVEMEDPEHHPLEYSLRIGIKGAGHTIASEVLAQLNPGYDQPFKHIDSSDGDIRYYETAEKKLTCPDWDYNPLETSLSQVPKMFRDAEHLRRVLSAATSYHVLDVGPTAPVKLPQLVKPASLPGANGEELVPYLFALREGAHGIFEGIIDVLRGAFPSLEDLNFPVVATGMQMMTWKDKNFDRPIYMNELSEGTLRFIWLVSLLCSPELSSVTMIDEPEVSLHPELLNILSELMRDASRRTQIIVATHSDRFIRFLRPEEIVVMDIDDEGCASAGWADSMELDEWLAEYSMDEVWRMGRIGGRS